jgi:hypothetical protein
LNWLATDGTTLFWGDYGADGEVRSWTCGGGVRTLTGNRGPPGPLAVDATSVYELERRLSLGGEKGIRTPGTLTGTPDFESGTFGLSVISPPRKLVDRAFLVKPAQSRSLSALSWRPQARRAAAVVASRKAGSRSGWRSVRGAMASTV